MGNGECKAGSQEERGGIEASGVVGLWAVSPSRVMVGDGG